MKNSMLAIQIRRVESSETPIKKTMLLFAFCILAILQLTNAQTTITSSAGGGSWSATGSWTGGVIPGANDSVVIANGNITVGDNRSCGSITIPSGKTLTISNTFTLTVGRTATAPTPILGGYLTNNGTLTSGGATSTIQMGTNGVIGGSANITIGQLRINPTNTTDIVYLNNSRIIISNGGTLFLMKGFFNIGIANTVQAGTSSGITINATGGGNFATTGANGGEDGGNVDCRAGSGGTLSISGTGSVGSPTFYNVFNGSTSDANWRFGCTTAGVKVDGTLSSTTFAGATVANSNQWAATGNAPVYGPNATLLVNRSGQGWTPSLEWSATSGYVIGTTPGYPNNVTIVNVGTSNYNAGGCQAGVNISTAISINGTLSAGNGTLSGAVAINNASFSCGGIIVDNGSVLCGGTSFTCKGSWLRKGGTIGTYTPGATTITFSGSGTSSAPQTIGLSTTAAETSIANITIANGTYVKLNSPVSLPAAGVLTLTSGKLETGITNILRFLNSATGAIAGNTGSATNCITGPIKKLLVSGGTTNYTFPLAAGTTSITYLPISFSSKNSNANDTATIQAFSPGTSGTAGTGLSAIQSSSEYWSLATSTALGTAGSTVTITRPSGTANAIGKSTTAGGTYDFIGSASNATGTTNDIGTASPWFFAFGQLPVPVITLADNSGGQVAVANLGTGSTDNLIASFQVTVATVAATLQQVTFSTTGTAASGTDITNFKLYYSATNSFAARTLVTGTGATLTALLGTGSHVFGTGSTLTQSIPVGVGYFWITADIAATAGANNLQVSGIAPATNLLFASGAPTGSSSQAGLQTIVVLPSVTTSPATSTTTTGAVLNGSVNANGPATNNKFDWGLTQYDNTNVDATTNPIASGTSPVSVALSLSGLTANTLYNFRVKSDNGNPGSPVLGSNLTFTTLSNAPTVGTGTIPTSNGFTASWAAPGAQGGASFTYTVQVYNLSNTLVLSVPSLTGTSAAISNVALSSNTAYYFRVIAVNAGGNSAQSAGSANITTGDADTDGAAPAVGNNINSIANQFLLRSRQRTRYIQDDGASNTVNGLAAITLKLDNGGTQPPSGLGPNTKYAWYMVNQGGNNYSLQNVFTQRYIINGGGTPGDGYVGNVAGSCDTRNWNTVSLVDPTTFNGIANTNKKWFTRSVNATIYYQFASLFGATDGNYAGYFINTDYTGTNNGNNANNVLVSAVSCASTTRDFEFTTYTATPDLEVTGVTTNLISNTAAINTAFTATATIRNNGLLAITNGTNIKVKFVLDGKIFTTTYSGGLAAGASVVLPAVNVTPAILTAGSPLVVTVNSNWAIAEYNYSNNIFTIPNVVVLQPVLNVSGTLSAVSTVYGSGTPFTSYTVDGTSLASNIVVTAAPGYQVSQTNGTSGYAASQNVVPVSNTVPTTTIYVRVAPTSSVAGSPYSGNVTNATTGVITQNVATVSSTVSPAVLTINGVSANNKPYNGNVTATLSGAPSYVGLQNGESFSVSGTPSASFADASAGTGKPVTISGYTAPNTNYTLPSQPLATADIMPVALTVTADNKSKNYDGNTYSGGYTSQVAGFVNGENPGVVTGTVSYTGAATTAIAAGSHVITPDVSGLSAANYTFTPVNGTLTINPVSQSLADFRSKTNGSLSSAATWEYNGGGGTWISATQKPGTGNNVEVLHNVTFDEAFIVGAGKTLKPTTGTADFNGQSVTFVSNASGTASLGEVSGTLSGATNVTVERYIPDNGFRSWRLLSVPVTTTQTIRQAWQEGDANPNAKDNNLAGRGTQITGVFATQAAAAAAGFDSTSVNAAMLRWSGSAWANVTSTNQPLNSFSSYFLYIRGERSLSVTGAVSNSSATTLRAKGTVFTGDQTNSIGANAFGLVPNLYPSAVNFTGLTRTGGVNNLFYIWDSKKLSGNSLGVYQTFSGTNSFNCLVGGGSYVLGQPNTTIESGQSFFVTSGAAGTITLRESAKISGTNGSLGFRPAGAQSKIGTRLYNSAGEMLDANTVVFDAGYDKEVAGEDAPKMGNPGANFAIERGNKLLAIEGTQPVKEGDAIQFRMWNLAQGTYSLEVEPKSFSLPEGVTAILEDSYLKASTAINLAATNKVAFTVNQDASSSSANRFKIMFVKAGPAATNSKPSYTIAPNPVEGSAMNLQLGSQPAGRYAVRIVGAGGQAVWSGTINHAGGTAAQSISLPAGLAAGTYTVEIVAPGKTRSTQTVLINRK